MKIKHRIGVALATIATCALVATPLSAEPVRIPMLQHGIQQGQPWQAQSAAQHRRWRDRDYRWGGYGRRYRDRGIDGGDLIIAGAILGTIAVIAGAADNDARDRRSDRRDDPRWRYRDRPSDGR